MPLADTLIEVLQRSRDGEVFAAGGLRDIDEDRAMERAASICAEINETMLPRRLTFRVGNDSELVVHAGGRRLLKVVKVEPASLVKGGPEVFATRDDKTLAQQNKGIGELIGAFAARNGALTVLSAPPDTYYAAGAIGFMPDKLEEFARATAAQLWVPPPPAAKAAAPAPAGDAAKKLDPTAAMKALIKAKSEAAAQKPVAPVKPPSAQPATGEALLQAFFDQVGPQVDFCAILNAGGNVESVSGSLDDNAILNQAAQIVTDMMRWRGLTKEILSPTQLIVMRAGGIQNQSLAYFVDAYGVGMAVFSNTDLSRVFQLANKVLRPNGPG
ncbi:hypothetical protein [Neogemmobacter tilapiae]|uniref:Uncharacterized protein n=1 Tax=Neogemmobacter tilapiae TaxID=875041 RepID=A0A918TWZ7_9RHOB|nr:hypothetical protein [Gemmobacter tilapiae]GHC66772.1 hypothetical protein GCM10007315_34610 [Gemmobacter tilapiae]